MKKQKPFLVKGRKASTVPCFQQELMMAPSLMIESPEKSKSNVASVNAIMDELGKTKSRVSKVCYVASY